MLRNLLILLCVANILAPINATAAEAGETAREVRQWRSQNEQAIVDQFVQLLSIPNVAADSVNIRRNAKFIQGLMEPRGFRTRLLETPGSPPAVYGERPAPGASKTLMIYVHYDGQPVNAADWASDPWTPVLRSDLVENGGQELPLTAPFDPQSRIFARSAGDDKAPVIALVAALDALAASGHEPSVNLKIFFEGEEEAGSPHLQQMLATHRDLLQADLWLFCDGPVHQSRDWQLVYGVRGSFGLNLTVHGPQRPLHSGHYGNWAPNPIVMLMDLLATMRDSEGNILIDGYHDSVRPLTAAETEAIARAPNVDQRMIAETGIGRPETSDRLELAVMRPALNLRGIRSGDVGAASRNAIQVSATASVGLRLVPDLTPALARQAIEAHIRKQGWHIVYEPPGTRERRDHARIVELDWSEAGYPAYRAPLDLPLARQIAGILDGLSERPLIELPTMGGSLPIYLIEQETGSPVVILPIANHDNNQHGKDENLRLQNLWDAIEIYAAVITQL